MTRAPTARRQLRAARRYLIAVEALDFALMERDFGVRDVVGEAVERVRQMAREAPGFVRRQFQVW